MNRRRHESPLRRRNPSGKVVWVARFTGRDGKRRSAGTFDLRRDAQAAIDEAYQREQWGSRRDTVGAYFDRWLSRHPRSDRTNHSYAQRMGYVLDVPLDGLAFRDWPLCDLRRRHATDLLDVLLTTQKRSASGAQGVLRVVAAMLRDALDDELLDGLPFSGVRVRANDPRVVKPPREVRVWSMKDMHRFADTARRPPLAHARSAPLVSWRLIYAKPMVRVLSDCGLRLGELLALRRTDLKLGACDEPGCGTPESHFHVRFTAHEGRVQAGTKTDHGKADAGRVVPIPAGLERLLRDLPPRIDTMLLFPSTRGKVWRERNFIRDVWQPAVQGGFNPTRHEFRHSWISHMRAAGIDPADLAAAAGHTVQTATAHYTHALFRSFGAMREAVG